MSERSTKRQRELLGWVDGFIKEHGYGPSYREIMHGLGYKSVSTVAVHIEGLLTKGYIRKRDHSARSIEVVSAEYDGKPLAGRSAAGETKATAGSTAKQAWLVSAIDERFSRYEQQRSPQLLDELYVLIGALKVLGFDTAYEQQRDHLTKIIR